ncbi:MAG: protease-like activity factor CPAF [Parachlamydiaceae bacterium]|nr:protease-like activity factor CPAF [Parachlamydiaceae bacterium]
MRSLFFKTTTILCLNVFISMAFGINQDQKKSLMINDLMIIKQYYDIHYAPLEWKKEKYGWDLNEAYEKSVEEILITPELSTKQFHQIVQKFCNSMHDYHVKAIFLSSEYATLPFTVTEVDGRFFIDCVNKSKLPEGRLQIKVGDEIIGFGEQTPQEVMKELKSAYESKSINPKTNSSMLAIGLTQRFGYLGDEVPKGPIIITVKTYPSEKETSYQLMWNYHPEIVPHYLDFMQSIHLFPEALKKNNIDLIDNRWREDVEMSTPFIDLYMDLLQEDSVIGKRNSFVPRLGNPMWINGDEFFEDDIDYSDTDNHADTFLNDKRTNDWNAYIYRNKKGKKIGYIRIPRYRGDEQDVGYFGEIIERMEKETEALIIDQVNNPGGLVFYMYELASMLTSKPLSTPHHCIKLTYGDAIYASEYLEKIRIHEVIKKPMNHPHLIVKNNSFIQGLFVKNYFESILSEWYQGKTLTKPIHLWGVDMINPHPHYRYTKPLVILINELDTSGGDFFPMIFKNNERAVLFGTETAGAGGCTNAVSLPNQTGIALITNTWSIVDCIENKGAVPDFRYEITIKDVISNYAPYAEALNQVVDQLIKKPSIEKEHSGA